MLAPIRPLFGTRATVDGSDVDVSRDGPDLTHLPGGPPVLLYMGTPAGARFFGIKSVEHERGVVTVEGSPSPGEGGMSRAIGRRRDTEAPTITPDLVRWGSGDPGS
jgi:hypothetical protein